MHGRAWLLAVVDLLARRRPGPGRALLLTELAPLRNRAHYYSHARMHLRPSMEPGASRVIALAIGHLTRLVALRHEQQPTPR